MNFEFSDEQNLLREQALGFLQDNCPPSAARAILDGDASYDEALWGKIAEMGWTATAIPEAHGGLGLSYLELCVIAEELGFFTQEGLTYEFRETIRTSDGKAHDKGDKQGAMQSFEAGRKSDISCACHWIVNVAAAKGHGRMIELLIERGADPVKEQCCQNLAAESSQSDVHYS